MSSLEFLAGGGVMGALIRDFRWAGNPLGPPEAWPQPLQTAVSLMLGAVQPVYIAWGPELISLYNDSYLPILGRKHPQGFGTPYRHLWAELWEEFKPVVAAIQQGEARHFIDLPLRLEGRDGDGVSYFTFSWSPLRLQDGTVAGFYCAATETTRRVLAERELAEANAKLASEAAQSREARNRLWELSSDIMLRCTFDGTITAVNPAWTEVLGWREDELVGANLFDLLHPDDVAHTIEGAQQSSEGTALPRFDNRYRHKDGGYRWISWATRPAEGHINAVGRDVTAEKEQAEALSLAEEALRQSQKMEAVGQLTGGVAHDFNNLLTIIRSSVDFLRRPDLSEARRTRYLDAASDTVDRAAKLTGQLLAFARRQALKPEVFDVAAKVHGVADMLDTLTGARIRIATRAPDEPCFVRADAGQFETALVNMAVNARDAMEGEGTITLSVSCAVALPAIRGHAAAPGPFTAIVVSDSGSGIDPDLLGRIFEPFFTTKEVGKGTGLGLSQVFGFAKQSGGDVDVVSVVGEGTTFTLYLPEVSFAELEGPPAQAEAAASALGAGQRVLVVEDNIEVGRFCTQILEDLGYRTAWATSAEDALALLEAGGEAFDIVFSDVVMPGMGGVALAKILRQRFPDLLVLLTSGYSHVLAREEGHGFELLQKPYSAEQLGQVLRHAICQRERLSEPAD